jgi:hypothetical protein
MKHIRHVCSDLAASGTHLLKPEDKPDVIATFLTKQIRTAIHGDAEGFNRRLDYPDLGWL